ncbi:MAG: phage capsid protein [Ruminococcus sp.]|nr:phage capsid protein [Ruminococcus sp.]
MLTPSEYDRLCDQLTILYAALDESIIEDITRRMLKTGRVTDAARWQAQQLQQAGMLYEDVLAEIAKRTDATQAHVRALFEDAGVQAIRNDNRYYKAAGLEGIVKMSDAALQTLHAGFVKCAGNLQNLTLTTANTAQQAYIQASDLAYMQVTTGSMDYNTAIRHAIRSAADEGSFVLYPSGHRDRLDVAVRRAVLTGVGQTVRQLSLINAEDMGCDLMEITAHGGARPSHAEWQGKIVSRSGRRGYLTLHDIGYGRGDGFGGWNCRHDWHPFFEGISHRAYTDARLRELEEPHTEIDGKKYTDYEVTQMQRALERNIRKQKRQVAAANAMVESAPDEALRQAAQADFTRESVKLKAAEQELKNFCKQTGFLPDTSRVWVNGFGRSVSQKAVHANKTNLTFKDYHDIISLRGTLSDRDTRAWYLAHDRMIPDLIDRSKTIEEQARQACDLRNQFRTQARELMADQEKRRQLDITDPNRSFEELIADKMQRKGLSREEAIADVLQTATKTRASVNKILGLE